MKSRAPRIPRRPVPAAIVEGLELYDCPPLCARITVTTCDKNRSLVGGMRARRRLKDIAEIRRPECADCPGVLAIARKKARAR